MTDLYGLQTSKVARRVHPVMQYANDSDTVIRDPKINHVPLDVAAAVPGTNMVTGRR